MSNEKQDFKKLIDEGVLLSVGKHLGKFEGYDKYAAQMIINGRKINVEVKFDGVDYIVDSGNDFEIRYSSDSVVTNEEAQSEQSDKLNYKLKPILKSYKKLVGQDEDTLTYLTINADKSFISVSTVRKRFKDYPNENSYCLLAHYDNSNFPFYRVDELENVAELFSIVHLRNELKKLEDMPREETVKMFLSVARISGLAPEDLLFKRLYFQGECCFHEMYRKKIDIDNNKISDKSLEKQF